jgi:hypothetical protein
MRIGLKIDVFLLITAILIMGCFARFDRAFADSFAFGASPLSGLTPLTVTFTDTSTPANTEWSWDFGDGATSTLQNPVHVYTSAGSYRVTLTASGAGETATIYKTITVSACSNNKAKLADNFYPDFLSAYTLTTGGQSILLQALDFAEDFNLTQNMDVTIRGGYNCDYSDNVNMTTVTGKLIIGGNSKVTIDNIKIATIITEQDIPWTPTNVYLPIITINTTNAQQIASKEIYLTGTYRITDVNGDILHEGELGIKGRGHTTWSMPKKPYKLKLADSTALMGMPGNKHWVLLANYSDKTLLRNETAFELSRLLAPEYTPRSVFVELYLNGAYRGVYQLTEHVRIGKDRVNIPELKVTDTSEENISGGYLIEVDERRGENYCFDSTKTTMVFCLANPETLLEPGWEQHKQYIVNYINQTDAAIFGEQFTDPATGYAAYIDVDSAIHYYLINELFKNVDGNLRVSTFLFKKRGGKLTFGPIWDFDIAIGNVNYNDADMTHGWYIRNAAWFKRMFEDPAFEQKVTARWAQMKKDGTLTALFQHIDSQAAFLNDAQVNNFEKWPILSIYVWPNRVVTGSYAGEINAMKEWLSDRIIWMDAQLSE